jgi:hypothetical protein
LLCINANDRLYQWFRPWRFAEQTWNVIRDTLLKKFPPLLPKLRSYYHVMQLIQSSAEHMRMMTHTDNLIKKLKDAEIQIARLQGQFQSTQRRCNELETELQRLESPPNCSNDFVCKVVEDFLHTLFVPLQARRYSEQSYELAFILRSQCAYSYRLVRKFLLLPTVNNADNRWRRLLRDYAVSLQTLKGTVGLLMRYRERYQQNDLIECTLGVDAMAIESYATPSDRLLMRPGQNGGLQTVRYFFVFYLMPVTRRLPKIIIKVIPHKDDKAAPDTGRIMLDLKDMCAGQGFRVINFAGDGDCAFHGFMKQLYNLIWPEEGPELSFRQLGTCLRRFRTFSHLISCTL